jgi:hypothetical protein
MGPVWSSVVTNQVVGWLLAQSFSSAPTRHNQRCPMSLSLSIINRFDEEKGPAHNLPIIRMPFGFPDVAEETELG